MITRPATARCTPLLARTVLVAALVVGLAACGDPPSAHQQANGGNVETLPAPGGNVGVTGKPDVASGKGTQSPSLGEGPLQLPSPAELGIDGDYGSFNPAIDPSANASTNPETGLQADPDGDGPLTAPPATDSGASEPTPADAVALIRNYYAAITAQDYPRAYALWSDDGNASGQTPEQFQRGFANTRAVTVEVGAPGREDAGAGQRHIAIPIGLRASQADGSVRRFVGTYVLHRTIVDGATPAQRSWRIRSADLREVQQ